VLLRDDGVYIVIRAADVKRLATDPRTRQLETEYVRSRGVTEGALFELFNNSMLLSNGPTHRWRRAPVSHAFAYKLLMGLLPRVNQIARGSHMPRGRKKITRNGRKTAVTVSMGQSKLKTKRVDTLADFFASSPLRFFTALVQGVFLCRLSGE